MIRIPRVSQRLGNGLLLLGPVGALYVARSLADSERRARQGDGLRPPVDWIELRDDVEAAAAEARAFAGETAKPPVWPVLSSSAVSSTVLVDPVDTAVASVLLGCSPQAVRARCRRGEYASAVRRGDVWLIERHEVEAAAVTRSAS